MVIGIDPSGKSQPQKETNERKEALEEPEGTYTKVVPQAGEPLINAQEMLLKEALSGRMDCDD